MSSDIQGMMQAIQMNMVAVHRDLSNMHRQMHRGMGQMHREHAQIARASARSAREHARDQRHELRRMHREQLRQTRSRQHDRGAGEDHWHDPFGYSPMQRQSVNTSVVNGHVYVNDELVTRVPHGVAVSINSSGGVVRLNGRTIWPRAGDALLPPEGTSEVQQPLGDTADMPLRRHRFRAGVESAQSNALSSSCAGISPTDQEEPCSVCLDDIKAGQQIRTLPCFHFLHRHCAEAHFARPSVLEPGSRPCVACPVCRVKVEPESTEFQCMSL